MTLNGNEERSMANRAEDWFAQVEKDRDHAAHTWLAQIVIDTISTPEPVATETSTWSDVKDLFR